MLAIVAAVLVWCTLLGVLLGGDPLLAVEIGGLSLAIAWAALLSRDLLHSRRLGRDLAIEAEEVSLHGVPCRLTDALGTEAIVVGALRPRIYLGRAMCAALSSEEIRAVVYHEDHHRRTRAPMRAAALEAWIRLLGGATVARRFLVGRLADLETLADADAIQRGSSATSLARALLKGDVAREQVSFAYVAQQRVERLLESTAGAPLEAPRRLPYEWLLVLLLAVTVAVCHAVL
ncbi:MAG: hypothetical protein ACC726_06605 [Chloroflexota bacterium]